MHLALDPSVELHQGATAQIRGLGLLGDKYVELLPGAPKLRASRTARFSRGSRAGFDDLTKLASDIGKDLKEESTALANSLGGQQGEERLNRIVDNFGRLAESLREIAERTAATSTPSSRT